MQPKFRLCSGLALAVCLGTSLSARAEVSEVLVATLQSAPWGWPDGEHTCALDPQTIAFSPDRATMKFTWMTSGTLATYRVLYFEGDTLTAYIEGEDRLTEHGDRVIWVLKLQDKDHFCWRRTDWPSHACTQDQVRCVPRG